MVSAGAAEVGLVVILMAMLAHWKYWLAGGVAFFVGANWRLRRKTRHDQNSQKAAIPINSDNRSHLMSL